MKTLVVYYSFTGSSRMVSSEKTLAEWIAALKV